MRKYFPRFWLLVATLLVFGAAVPVASAPAGGGGGGTSGGIIYYIGPTEGGDASKSIMTAMDFNGGNKTWFALGLYGNPSREVHNNCRWFIRLQDIASWPQSGEVFALRDHYDPFTNNTSETSVQLTNDITLEVNGFSLDWVPGDGQISFKGRRWSSAEPGAIVVEGGIYTAPLAFDGAGNITGLAAPPAMAIPFPLVETAPGDWWPAFADYNWAPAGDRVVYTLPGNSELWLADLLNAHTRIYSGFALRPQWSPDGGKIAFSNASSSCAPCGGISTIKIDGSGLKQIVPGTSSGWRFSHPFYSPFGSHIVFYGRSQSNTNRDVFRATATGGNRTNLTNTGTFLEYPDPGRLGGGWR